MDHILVIDDDTRIRTLLKKYLQEHGFFVSTTEDAAGAYGLLEFFTYDLLIVDRMMPGENGVEFIRNLRKNSSVAILMLTAMGEVEDRIEGLESGADDYLPKPFEPRELLVRIERILTRARPPLQEEGPIFRFGNFVLDSRQLTLTKAGEPVMLTGAEAKLLLFLAERSGEVISREKLAQLCGGVNERTIDVQIIRLRQKIESDQKKPLFLKTIRGEGYVLGG